MYVKKRIYDFYNLDKNGIFQKILNGNIMVKKKFCFNKSVALCLLSTFLFLNNALSACMLEEDDLREDAHLITKPAPRVENFRSLPKEMMKEITDFLEPLDKLQLRQTDKMLKLFIDYEYVRNKKSRIRAPTSSPAIECIKDIPFRDISLFFDRWKEKDIEKLLYFKKIDKLWLQGLSSGDFTTCEGVFN
ncbi:MAG: hypothetical protein H0X26_07955 [Alphaproteobacteria bacterium]|nr:hypothetical protein [Alphaproteobacteria bacterium]